MDQRLHQKKQGTQKLNIVSLFSGIGGLDKGFSDAGFNVIWANDFDKYAVKTYNCNFPNPAICADLNEIDINTIPEHDVLIGGFPCQPFSMMGKEKGFDDKRGTLFFRVVEIIINQRDRGHQPRIVVLENVRNLLKHDKGRTFKLIKETLENLGYHVFADKLNSADYGVPQSRRRVVFVGLQEGEFEYPEPVKEIVINGESLEVEDNRVEIPIVVPVSSLYPIETLLPPTEREYTTSPLTAALSL